MSRIFKIILISNLLLFLTGCSSILIADETVLTLNSEMPLTASINSFTTDQPGRICDITKDNKYILSIGNNNTSYTIDSLQISNNQLVNLITSETEIYDVRAAANGFFYIKDNPSNNLNLQIVWATQDQTVERTVTENYDNISEAIFAYGKDNVIFINNDSEIIFSDSLGRRKSYTLPNQVEVSKIVWSETYETGFLAGRNLGNDYFGLYEFRLNGDQLQMSSVASNILDMDLSPQSEMLTYILQEKDTVQVYIIPDITTTTYKSLFSDDGIEQVRFSDDEKAIYFTKILGVGTRSTLWHYNIDERSSYQLTSPLRISSEIIPLSANNEVFFSSRQLSYLENSDLITSSNYISKLVYTLPKN